MSRPRPNRRRKRPGRRPPHRYQGGNLPIRPNSFQDFGLRHLYNFIMPDVRGRDRRKFFNQAGGWTALAMGLFGAAVGSSVAGPGGAIIGFFVALGLMVHVFTKHRFLR
jgi:hypothetical protein